MANSHARHRIRRNLPEQLLKARLARAEMARDSAHLDVIRVVAEVLTLGCHVPLDHLIHIHVLQRRCRSCNIEYHLDHSFRLGTELQAILNDYGDW